MCWASTPRNMADKFSYYCYYYYWKLCWTAFEANPFAFQTLLWFCLKNNRCRYTCSSILCKCRAVLPDREFNPADFWHPPFSICRIIGHTYAELFSVYKNVILFLSSFDPFRQSKTHANLPISTGWPFSHSLFFSRCHGNKEDRIYIPHQNWRKEFIFTVKQLYLLYFFWPRYIV